MLRWLNTYTTHESSIVENAAARAAKRYKHWKPCDSKKYDYTTQLSIDKAMATQWAERFLAAVRPYKLPYMVNNPEPHQQRRLLGRTKWMTLRTHALTIERKPSDSSQKSLSGTTVHRTTRSSIPS